MVINKGPLSPLIIALVAGKVRECQRGPSGTGANDRRELVRVKASR